MEKEGLGRAGVKVIESPTWARLNLPDIRGLRKEQFCEVSTKMRLPSSAFFLMTCVFWSLIFVLLCRSGMGKADSLEET